MKIQVTQLISKRCYPALLSASLQTTWLTISALFKRNGEPFYPHVQGGTMDVIHVGMACQHKTNALRPQNMAREGPNICAVLTLQ